MMHCSSEVHWSQ